eukprot:XP_011528114.1 uncharacterized protein LOC105372836 [Homo sapiens]
MSGEESRAGDGHLKPLKMEDVTDPLKREWRKERREPGSRPEEPQPSIRVCLCLCSSLHRPPLPSQSVTVIFTCHLLPCSLEHGNTCKTRRGLHRQRRQGQNRGVASVLQRKDVNHGRLRFGNWRHLPRVKGAQRWKPDDSTPDWGGISLKDLSVCGSTDQHDRVPYMLITPGYPDVLRLPAALQKVEAKQNHLPSHRGSCSIKPTEATG